MKSFAATALILLLVAAGCAKHDDSSQSGGSANASDASAASTAAASTAVTAAPDAAASSGGEADVASTAPAAPSAPPAAGSATDTPQVTISGSSFTVKQGNTTVSMGGAGTADLSTLGVPVYPNAKAKDSSSMEATENGVHTRMVVLTSSDAFDDVDGWYKAHLGSGYSPAHVSVAGFETSTYKQGDEQTLPLHTVLLQTGKDDAGAPVVTITLLTKEKG